MADSRELERPVRAPASARVGDMPAEELRRHAHRIADWIADYLETVDERPVLARVRPGDVRDALPESPPEEGEPFEASRAW